MSTDETRARARRNAQPRLGPVLLAAALAVFLIPTLIAPLTYPGVYEDEPWIFLPAFEALRGNGPTFAALGEGQSSSIIFFLFVTPLAWISPFEANLTLRLIAAMASVATLACAYLVARRLDAGAAFLAPIAVVAIPLTFLTLRYARMEAFALALGLGSVASALSGRVLVAGVLSALAVSIHPILVWIGVACLLAALSRDGWRGGAKYCAGGVLGLAPQALWTFFAADFSPKYLVTSSIAPGRFDIVASVLAEPDRYAAYIAGLAPGAIVAHVLLIGLALAGLALARGWTRGILVAIALGPLTSLAIFSLGKNPYYFVTAIPALAIAAAYGASKLPRNAAFALGAIALSGAASVHAAAAWESRALPTVSEVNRELARQLPRGAAVFSPLRSAGVIQERPDLRFYSFHALSPPDVWEMPQCDAIDRRLREIIAADPRRTSAASGTDANAVYLAMFGMPWNNYVFSIYGPQSDEAMACLLDAPGTTRHATEFCMPGQCYELDVRRRPLH